MVDLTMLSYLTRREILKKITNYLVAIFLMPFFSIKNAMAQPVRNGVKSAFDPYPE
jgi:hypothetical protein